MAGKPRTKHKESQPFDPSLSAPQSYLNYLFGKRNTPGLKPKQKTAKMTKPIKMTKTTKITKIAKIAKIAKPNKPLRKPVRKKFQLSRTSQGVMTSA